MDTKNKPSGAARTRRLFVGTFLKAQDMERLGKLKADEAALSDYWQRKIRFVPAQKLHLTWLFLGQVDESSLDPLLEKLGEAVAGFPALSLSFESAAFWPFPRGPRQLVLVPQAICKEVPALAATIAQSLQGTSTKDQKGFRPHVTLLRFGPGDRRPLSLPDWWRLPELLPVDLSISQISLIESCQREAPGEYRILRSFALC